MPVIAPLRSVLLTLLCTFGFLLVLAAPAVTGPAAAVFLLIAALVQTVLLSSPVLLLHALYARGMRRGRTSPLLAAAVHCAALFTLLFLVANYKLQQMFGFYFNYFVLNLLLTPGGVEAMGVSTSTNVAFALLVLGLAAVLLIVVRLLPLERLLPRGRWRWLPLFSVLLLTQALWYAWSEFRYERSILATADRLIWYVPVTAGSLLEGAGFTSQRPEQEASDLAGTSGSIDYPAAPTAPLERPLNIVWLVAESWRADSLTPTVMPQTSAFAAQTQNFLEHYSGGNGTRMGMFSQFYGLYGSYWFDFLGARRQPLLMELLRNNGYAMKAWTSSRFSYPEFDQTVFAGFPASDLHSDTDGDGWERDRRNVTRMLDFIETADAPFFSFMFFESAHANYYFPDESVIEPDYIDDFNYLTVDIERDIERIRARYINAVHHLDSQLARVFDTLEAQGLLESTIVIVTGDHGEEFMENGRWGHNSTFSQQQIRVPLLVHVPGQAAAEVAHMTSHLDLPATVLAALGVGLDPASYSYGSDLLSPQYARDYTVASDWHGNTLITPEVKMVFSKKGAALDDGTTTLHDEPVAIASVSGSYRDALGLFARELSRFYH
jgi:membrane-anchored protein YejM (alkaline phosphatase superfamily)